MSEPFVFALKKAIVLTVPLALIFAVWQMAVAPLLTLNRDLDEDAERSQALLRHYRMLVSQAGEVDSELQRLKESSGAEGLFYDTQNVNAAATLLQQRLGELVAATGGQIRAARVETKPKNPNYEPFAVNLTFATSSAGLSKLLFQLETLRPIVLVDNVFVNAGPALLALQHNANATDKDKHAAEDQVLDVALTVSAFALTKG
jgi:hypothetical protein